MKAFILAAGRGERMRPLTDATPKPLLKVRGKSLIEWQIEALVAQGLREIIINTAWLGEQIVAALGDGARHGASITYSHEAQALETAGALAFARHYFTQGEPFALVSADIYAPDFCFDKADIARFTQDTTLLAHLVMVPNPPFHPKGDYAVTAHGMLSNAADNRLTFSNFSLHRIALVEGIKSGSKAKLAPLWAIAADEQRVSASVYRGQWHNVGTVEQLDELNMKLAI
jgi:N-acetyl-alpha-D-muramate 1-phosphate uridylyltransferase